MADKKISALTGASTPLAGTEVLPIVQSGSTVKVSVANLTAGRGISATTVTTTAANAMASTGGGTGAGYSYITNTGGQLYWGVASSTGTGLGSGNNNYSAVITSFNATDLALGTNAVNRLNIGSTGDITFVSGNLIQGTASKGINFTANANAAGMTSELLNWYEEGTWTPVLSDGTNNATMHASTAGSYTRIGNTVFYRARVRVSSLGSVTGAVRVTGLPFTAANNNSNYGGSTVGVGTGLNITAGYAVSHLIVVGTSYLNLYVWDTAAGSTALDATEFSATGDIYFSGQYYV